MAQSILIVDDEKEIVSMLYCYFSKLGYTVYTATAGNAALKEVEKKPDIILLDVNMPDIDGFTVCERIRDYVSCPIIFLTARIEDSDKIKGFSIGADDYVIKPFSVDELEARIAAHLRREKRHNISSKVQFDEDMVIDYSSRIVFYHNKDMAFTKKESLSLICFPSGEFIPMEKRERVTAKITSILFPQSCSSLSALQYFQNSILRSIPCSILNCGIRRTKLICFRMRTWTEISNQFHEKIMKDCLRIFKKRTQPQYFQSR